jgi:hypothetical protein
LSLCFDKVTRKSLTGEKKTIEELGAIHIFKSQSGYATFPLKLSHRIDLNWRARDVVSNLGEPQKKTGGGSSPVSITYTNCDPKLEVIKKNLQSFLTLVFSFNRSTFYQVIGMIHLIK